MTLAFRLSALAAIAALASVTAFAQQTGGFTTEYLHEFDDTSQHVLQLAGAIPADKFTWRPAPGVRSISEVYVHIATANFLLLGLTGVKLPAEYYPDIKPGADGKPDLQAIFARTKQLEQTVTDKDQVIRMLKQSIDAVRAQLTAATPVELDKPETFFHDKTTRPGNELRLLAHLNEHYGQSIAYARMNGVVPPWSQPMPASKK
jgi:uncharacterized damage-inducible protein DinB